MFVELVESLRCPNEHEESPLIAWSSRSEGRHIVEGALGCPVCRAEFPIRDGVVVLGDVTRAPAGNADPADAMRLAAFLELTDARGFALLCGAWGQHAAALGELSATPVVLVNPPLDTGDAAGLILAPDRVPFAPGSARAAALDAGMPDRLTRSVVDAVRPGGRVLAPAGVDLPDGVREIARDDRTWVGEKAAAPESAPRLVTLRRAGR